MIAVVGALAIASVDTPPGLSAKGQYALATMYFAAVLWVSRAFPLAVTALSIPVVLTAFGVYDDMDPALAGFADPLIFLFIAGFMLANALQKYNIDRRIALWLIGRVGRSPRALILAVMIATAGLSMWISNTATTAMMTPIALGVLAQVVGREEVREENGDEPFSNMQIATLLGTAYAASVGGVGTLIGTPPNAVVVAFLNELLDYQITFADWLAVGLPLVVVTLPLVWYVLTFWLYPPEVDDVSEAQAEAAAFLEAEGDLSARGRRVAVIFVTTALLWVVGGLERAFSGILPPRIYVTLFGGDGATLVGTGGHQGLLYFVMVGLYAIPALVLADAVDWDDLADIDWGTILLFGGGLSLAQAIGSTGATRWIAESIFGALVGAPVLLVIGVVVVFVIMLTEMTSNTATTSIIAPILISTGTILATTLGLEPLPAAVVLSIAGAIAASYAFALPVSTPPNAIVFGSGYMEQEHMLRAGLVLNALMAVVLTILISLLFVFVWPVFLW
ncbi:DASS family sodium-coupled anion symporter [Haloarculaceae archaeon H-GB2-1]|nr:DASS family sodium-coupled anion symporter [Haloarculaceae archaeon H-GB1-1]MEA5387098.1 DASS family sodium-coupled anion symporter [Haloarculaceae archaeon H-GB11]MEA5408643.1 DASS family sodium-coupled anion symporter [Haloarculaceae archaeon H-GB2-1]